MKQQVQQPMPQQPIPPQKLIWDDIDAEVEPMTVTHADVYVAINAQYHDYCELFKSWFGDGVEQKIIESAVIFWFKDDDYKDGFKLWNYFKED